MPSIIMHVHRITAAQKLVCTLDLLKAVAFQATSRARVKYLHSSTVTAWTRNRAPNLELIPYNEILFVYFASISRNVVQALILFTFHVYWALQNISRPQRSVQRN